MLKKYQQGISLYLTIIIMVILLAVVLGVSTILLGQLKMIKGMENSVIAFCAADTGIERQLSEENSSGVFSGYLDLNDNGDDDDDDSFYTVTVLDEGENGCNFPRCVRSVGEFKGTKRAIELTYRELEYCYAGYDDGSYCWHEGAEGQSCTDVCSNYGGSLSVDCSENDDVLCSVCKSEDFHPGALCTSLSELIAPSFWSNWCYYREGLSDCDAGLSGYQRFCACKY